MRRHAFTLIEILVVVAILAILAGLLFPVFSQAKSDGKKGACLSNMRQIGIAVQLYTNDFDDFYPQTRQSSLQPDVDDASGGIDEPIYGSVFATLIPYVGKKGAPYDGSIFSCPVDPDPMGKQCFEIDPDAPEVSSYLANAYFAFGLNGSGIASPAATIYFSERRSVRDGSVDPFCDDIYRPWFNTLNPKAPEDEMDPYFGAVATQLHNGRSNFDFADGHTKNLAWSETYSPPNINLHSLKPLR